MGYFSSGSEGVEYEEIFCEQCTHDTDGGCPLLNLHLLHNYDECNKPESFLHVLIPRFESGENKECSMFIRRKGAKGGVLEGTDKYYNLEIKKLEKIISIYEKGLRSNNIHSTFDDPYYDCPEEPCDCGAEQAIKALELGKIIKLEEK